MQKLSSNVLANMPDLFENPIKAKKVRKNVIAYKYRNGAINICGVKYLGYNLTEAINKFRKQYPKYN
jgi:hypothetical protein